MTLTKAELADLLFEKLGFNKREAKDMVEYFFEEVRTALENGQGVKLSGFMLSTVKSLASGYLVVSRVQTCTCASMWPVSASAAIP